MLGFQDESNFISHQIMYLLVLWVDPRAVKVIAVQTLGLEEVDFPPGFGRAPSTLIFDEKQED